MTGDRNRASYRLGVDIGGTFTDIILVGNGSIYQMKLPSTPASFGTAVIDGVKDVLSRARAMPDTVTSIAHGTTVGTNAILSLQGSVTALVTTRGFRDVLELGRVRHPSLSDIYWEKPPALVPRRLRFELDERVNARGEIEKSVDSAQLQELAETLRDHGVESVAISLLNSYLNPAHERLVADSMRELMPALYTSASVDILPEIKEFERTSTAVVNAYTHPIVDRYVADLEREFDAMGVECPLLIMQSSGGLLSSRLARSMPVQLVESGPAAGVIATKHLASTLGVPGIVAFDMGGTTAKASLIEDGEPFVSQEYEVGGGMNTRRSLTKGGGYTIRVPSIDIAEVGAGGGSICWIDAGGAPRVGPISAGAMPGPACYGHGGNEPTLTDAIVVLGYVSPVAVAGGTQAIDRTLAEDIIRRKVAEPLGLDLLEAAYGIYKIAVANMSKAVRAVTSERGRDPRQIALVAFGGAGPAHAVELARDFGISTIIIPMNPGLFSAVGLLVADVEHYDVWSYSNRDDWDVEEIESAFEEMEKRTIEQLLGKYRRDERVDTERFADLRYAGQSSELRIPVPPGPLTLEKMDEVREYFEAEHERTYGHRGVNERIEVVNLRLRVTLPERAGVPLKAFHTSDSSTEGQDSVSTSRQAYFGPTHGLLETPVARRSQISGTALPGPLIIEDMDATTLVPPGSMTHRDSIGNIVITVGKP